MIEANWSIDGVSPLHEAQLGNSLRRDCSMHQQLSGKFCILLERARQDVLRPNSVVSPHLIPLQHKIWFIIDDDRHVAALKTKIARKGAGAILHPLHLFRVDFWCLLPLRAFVPWRCKTYWIVRCVMLYLRAWRWCLALSCSPRRAEPIAPDGQWELRASQTLADDPTFCIALVESCAPVGWRGRRLSGKAIVVDKMPNSKQLVLNKMSKVELRNNAITVTQLQVT